MVRISPLDIQRYTLIILYNYGIYLSNFVRLTTQDRDKRGGKMKNMKLCAILIFAFITLTNAQWLETTIGVGDGPRALVYNPTNNKVYCANYGSNPNYDSTVTVIDGATNAVITTITVGDGPRALVYNPTNNKVYCANLLSDNVTVIEGATNAVITTIAVGSYPRALVYNPTHNKVYCANSESDNVTVIDGATNTVITTIGVGDGPCALVYNPTDNKVYCANHHSDNVTVIDGATNAVITTIAVGDGPCALVYNPTNNKIYCANHFSDNVTVIDGATNAVITTIAVGDGPCAFTWNSVQNRTYVANNYSSSVSVIRDVTGIEEDQSQNTSRLILQIYPNPAKTFFIIHTNAAVQSVKIYDVLGKLIKAEELAEFNDEKQISLKGINSGVYFLKVNTADTEFIKKLIVTK